MMTYDMMPGTPRRIRPLGRSARSGAPRPDIPCYVVGPLCGGLDRLGGLLDTIGQDIEASGLNRSRIVFLGDLSGGATAQDVMQALAGAEQASDGEIVVLMGDRERALLDFLKSPPAFGPVWLAQGGRAMLSAFRISLAADITPDALWRAAAELAAALGPDLVSWLARRPLLWTSGNLVAAHAALDPGLPLRLQSPETVLNGHARFHTVPRTDGRWVVHGQPGSAGSVHQHGRIAVGGGLESQGLVSAARIVAGDPVRFLFSQHEGMRAAS
ncbi:hypothetical protein [Anianabacter salinae]|uniref:hypothetical protein n=1 Tax=Anianabacter salinae TaxID=2851023 RepID=UPI00225E425F|nr:hypothetical protein [Anianabacter salinae]MBV0911377.1 hypothetical protein [Anianabacter salinae]